MGGCLLLLGASASYANGLSLSWFLLSSQATGAAMEYHDKVLRCADCNAEFVFTAGEQMFFADKGFKNESKRCKDCKAKRSQSPGPGTGTNNFQRAETKTTCSQCGKETTV